MEIKYQDILTLNDDNEYVVASKAIYNDAEYIYLVDINDSTNIKFMEIEKDGSLTQLDSEIDIELINVLTPLFYNNGIEDIKVSTNNDGNE